MQVNLIRQGDKKKINCTWRHNISALRSNKLFTFPFPNHQQTTPASRLLWEDTQPFSALLWGTFESKYHDGMGLSTISHQQATLPITHFAQHFRKQLVITYTAIHSCNQGQMYVPWADTRSGLKPLSMQISKCIILHIGWECVYWYTFLWPWVG